MTLDESKYVAGIFDSRLRFRVRGNGSYELSIYTPSEELAKTVTNLCGGRYAQHGKGWRWTLYDSKKIGDLLAKVDPHVRVLKKEIYAVEAAAIRRHREDRRRRDSSAAQKRTAR